MLVKELSARTIKDSRGEQTIEVEIRTAEGKFTASAPSGKSKGKHEARAFSSKGINYSLAFISAAGRKLANDAVSISSFSDLRKVEEYALKVDKPPWNLIGANALYALEACLLKAVAATYKQELWQFLNPKAKKFPMPLGNVIGGGMHVQQETKADIQEFLLLPEAKHFFDGYFINMQAYKMAKKLVLEKDKRYENKLTDEQALAATLENEEIFSLLSEVRDEIKKKFSIRLNLGADFASSTFFRSGNYYYNNPRKKYDRVKQIGYVLHLIEKYNLRYVEDPLEEEDFKGFSLLLRDIQNKGLNCLLAGDDLTATQLSRVQEAVKEKSINAMIVKPNQNGSLLETKKIIDYCNENGITPIISHRSGETYDNTIAHLALGWQVPIIKTGILGKERFAKLHELLRIEREMKQS